MGIIIAEKKIEKSTMLCNETTQVILTISADNKLSTTPVDIALVLDESLTMNTAYSDGTTQIDALKIAVKNFNQLIANASTNTTIGNATELDKSTIGLVTFNDTVTVNYPLTSNLQGINGIIDTMVPEGGTVYTNAFNIARNVLNDGSNQSKAIVFVTDGNTEVDPEQDDYSTAVEEAQAAREAGIAIYAIGIGNGITNAQLLQLTGNSNRAISTSTAADLQTAFDSVAASISNTAPECINIVDILGEYFEIVGNVTTDNPTDVTSTYEVASDNKSITWDISALGVNETQTASLIFNVAYTGTDPGLFTINQSIDYTDCDNNDVQFANSNATIIIVCGSSAEPNDDYPCIDVNIPCCSSVVNINAPNTTESPGYTIGGGSLLNINIRFEDVCPNRTIIVGVIVCGTQSNGNTFSIQRVTTVSTPIEPLNTSSTTCQKSDLLVPLEVLIPELLNNEQQVTVRVIAHYISNSTLTCNKCSNS